MKYIRIIAGQTGPSGSYGILKRETIYLLDRSSFLGQTAEIGVSVPLAEVKRFLPPVKPPNIIALGLNYIEHAREGGWDLPSAPVIFLKATTSLTGHLSPIILPAEAPSEVDYEAELTIVIGKEARDVPEEKALDYVFGYTCGNDVSARDCQMRMDKQWARAKSFDTFAPIGPVIETELDPSGLAVHSMLNGKVLQDGNTRDLIFKIPAIVSYLSWQMTLLPQTLIMTGTPPGVGFARKPPIFLKLGDRIEVEIEGIGTLINSVVAER